MINALVINESDTVAVAIENIEKDEEITVKYADGSTKTMSVLDHIPIYHKLAVKEMDKGNFVVKYGEHIGRASEDIKIGKHVHEHNVENVREDLYVK